MKFLEKLFFGIKMTWLKVIIMAVVSGVVTAAVMIIPLTANTSLSNMGTTFEIWVLLALIIIVNCEKPLEAGLKTFVFFLISQPLIYLVQVPFSSLGWGLFMYYKTWFVWTLLTFPGGIIAWFVKKDNILSTFILSVATVFLGYELIYFIQNCMVVFPKHLLTICFIVLLDAVLIITLLKKPLNRAIAASVTVLAVAAFFITTFVL